AEARATAVGERKRRRLAVALLGSVLLMVLAGGGGWLWVVQDRAARQAEAERSANLALGKAAQLADQAGKGPPETVPDAERVVVLWRQAQGSVEQAEEVLASVLGAEAARERLATRRQEVAAGLRRAEAAQDQAHKEATLLTDLDRA